MKIWAIVTSVFGLFYLTIGILACVFCSPVIWPLLALIVGHFYIVLYVEYMKLKCIEENKNLDITNCDFKIE